MTEEKDGRTVDSSDAKQDRRSFLKKSALTLAGAGALSLTPEASKLFRQSRFSGRAFAGQTPNYEVYALKYGEMRYFSNILWFWLGLPPIQPKQEVTAKGTYYWLIKGPNGNFLFDTGMVPEVAKAHHIADYEDHATVLAKLDLKIDDISALIISHAHFDHINGGQVFKKKDVPVYIQEACYLASVEEYPGYPMLKQVGMPAKTDVDWLLQMMWAGRLKLVQGERGGKAIDIAPGISVTRVDGHYKGLQIVTVQTAKGPVVLTSDASYLYANMDMNIPVGLFLGSLTDVMDGLVTCRNSAKIRVPGHDMEVEKRFKAVKPGVFRIA